MLHLVLLAAGLGRRFGGDKQQAPVGPGGAWIMDYTVADALGGGFESVVCVVRPDNEAAVREHLEERFGGRIGIATVEQTPATAWPAGRPLPPGRRKPWGTAHAVLCAAPHLDGPFAVANADDHYGPEAIAALAAALRDPTGARDRGESAPHSGGPAEWALVAYPLADTLSPHGGVNRGLCRIGPDGRLRSVEEVEGIRADAEGRLSGVRDGRTVPLRPDDRISMNLWGLDPAAVPILREAFEAFVDGLAAATAGPAGAASAGELALPDVIGAAVVSGAARVRVLPEGRGWVGMTWPADRTGVERALAERGEPSVGPPDA
jgi:hypothetical protein